MKKAISLLLCAVLILALVASCAKPAVPLSSSELLNLGEKFLLEFDYEQAIVQFLAVIEIEPMNARAYLGAAEAYVGLGDTPAAIAILTQGLAATDDAAIAAMLARLAPPPHEHTWQPANYQEPAICIECGETDGEPLAAAFETLGITKFMQLGESVPYTTRCYDNTSVYTTGNTRIDEYLVVEADESRVAKEGYEWRIVQFSSAFSDDNAQRYGALFLFSFFDYYADKDVEPYIRAIDEESNRTYTLNHHGEDLVCDYTYTTLERAWINDVLHLAGEYAFQVPIGYDGLVIAISNARHQTEDDGMLTTHSPAILADPNTLYFRLD